MPHRLIGQWLWVRATEFKVELYGRCLAHGLRVVQVMTLMTLGLYNEPAGTYLPSILY